MSGQDRSPLLRVEDVHRRFGGIRAVDGCSLEVSQGRITGLIGPNGAGKTTLFNCISGFLGSDRGRIFFRDRRIDGLPPHRVFHLGLVRSFQITKQLEAMTVLENVLLAGRKQAGERPLENLLRRRRVREQEREAARRGLELLRRIELQDKHHELAANLSGGEKRLLEFARVEMAEPELILLDEPSSGVNPALKEALARHIRRLNREGQRTFLIIGHDMRFIMNLCDPIHVMNQGRVLRTGSPDEIAADPEVLDVYLGRA